MSLSEYKVVAGLAVSDIEKAREFYEGKLGLSVGIDSVNNLAYRCAEGTVMHVYSSPEHAGARRQVDGDPGKLVRGRRREGRRRTHLKGRHLRALRRGNDRHRREGYRHVRGRRPGRLLQGPGRQHTLDRREAAFLIAVGLRSELARECLFTHHRGGLVSQGTSRAADQLKSAGTPPPSQRPRPAHRRPALPACGVRGSSSPTIRAVLKERRAGPRLRRRR